MRESAKMLMGAISDATSEVTSTAPCFETVFTLYHRTVFRVAYNIVADPALAEDVTQEVFLRLYKNINALPDEELLRAWLIRVTLNVARNTVRGTSRATVRDDAYFKHTAETAIAEPEVDYERKTAIETVRRALAQVKEPLRSCLMLKQQGLSYKEIAATLDLNETSIGTFVARGRKEFLRFYGAVANGQ